MFGAIAEAKHMCEALSTPVLEQTAAWPATGKTFRGLETLLSGGGIFQATQMGRW